MLDHPVDPARFEFESGRKNVIPNGVLGMIIFVFCEVMFFAGMISAHMITRENAVDGVWPPPGSPMLPVVETGINTAFLFLSAFLLFLGHRAYGHNQQRMYRYLLGAVAFGTLFVGLQGREWAGLIEAGLTFTKCARFLLYFIVGTHALHALCALVFMAYMLLLYRAGRSGHHFLGGRPFGTLW